MGGKKERTAVLLLAPETGRLPEGMGGLAPFISGKSGGLGEVIAALCEGLTERGVECHVATLNLRRRFQQESSLNDDQWYALRHCINPERIHLVTSAVFSDLPGAYAGNPLRNAAEFQKEIVNHTITRVRAMNGGRLIIHSHDWMAGGVVTAYTRSTGCPVLHTVHNVHTGHIPLSMLGFAAAHDVFGASLYEPCGQIDQLGNLYGATATNRDTGGYHDKIEEMSLQADGAPEDRGNGFLFWDYDAGGLWYGLSRSVAFHRRPPGLREAQLRRMMRETRERHSMEKMIDGYLTVYERINGGKPLG
ncbi:MAG: glycogen/starch synthase [Deltaproteobacteria bacterium]|nr:glycogen/starch synthase [Deltaproteobacteria bacterium]